MDKLLIIGNPNVGKSTLFNSLTRSQEHTGNFHGVTVDSKSKRIKHNNKEFEIVDLPGIYSLNTFSPEEEITKNEIIKNSSHNIVLLDCNSLRKNLYLCLQLDEIGVDYKIFINNYKYFKKHNNQININKLKDCLNKDIEIVDAKKIKFSSNLIKNNKNNINLLKNNNYLIKFLNIVKAKYNLEDKIIKLAFNGIFNNLTNEQIEFVQTLYPDIINARYNYIDNILNECVEYNKEFIYGYSKLDKVLLNPIFAIFSFLIFFFLSTYIIFFLIGPCLSDFFNFLIEILVINPISNLIMLATDNIWVIEFVTNGIFSSFSTVFSFLPQVCLLFVFITLLEDSGLISRLSFVLDDFLSNIGLNGKAVYFLLLGLGCNTMSTMATRTVEENNTRIKSAIINPYISCMARLPIYVIVASAFFSKFAYFVVVGIYILGIIVALITCYVLNKTILKSKTKMFLLEFAPLRHIDFKHLMQVSIKNAKEMFVRIFGMVFCVGVIIWILTHTQFNFKYTQDINNSILFYLASVVGFIFAPIGLNSNGVVCALIVGVMAKELIVSTMSITNNVTNNSSLIKSLLVPTSVINFNLASAISFLIFSSLYCPCISNLAVLKKETCNFFMWFSVILQFTTAYMLSFVVYQTITKGWLFMLIAIVIIALILLALIYIKKHFFSKCGRNCLNCSCNKKS